ncbi:MAG: aminotransferase class V-fold PLP-dependent enzyme [Minisyncoccia bacterium]|jgi:phosphoserine aminotransferase
MTTNPVYFTVGPSQLHPKFETFIGRANQEAIGSISHRSERFCKLYADLSENLKKLFAVPGDYAVFFAASATEFMERTVQNCSEKGTLHFVNGVFSKKFFEIAQANGRAAVAVPPNDDQSFSLDRVPPGAGVQPELVCLTHNETSNGTTLPRDFQETVRTAFPDALLALDIVSSAPTSEIDCAKFDCIFFSVQKGFGLPAGLAAIFVSPRAIRKAEQIEAQRTDSGGGQYTGSFHSFANLQKHAKRHQTPETPNVLGMYLLNEVCLDFLARGIPALRAETKEKAALIYAALEKYPPLTLTIRNKKIRSQTVAVAEAKQGSKEIIEALKQKGFVIASGYGAQKESQIRIGNFPSHTKEQVAKLCEALRDLPV